MSEGPSTVARKTGKPKAVDPRFVLYSARRYFESARQLATTTGDDYPQSEVVHFLCYHAIELALKFFLLSHGKNPWGHEVVKLFKECQQIGLVVPSTPNAIEEVLLLMMQSNNQDQGLRYFTTGYAVVPEAAWLLECVRLVLDEVGKREGTFAAPIKESDKKRYQICKRPVARGTQVLLVRSGGVRTRHE